METIHETHAKTRATIEALTKGRPEMAGLVLALWEMWSITQSKEDQFVTGRLQKKPEDVERMYLAAMWFTLLDALPKTGQNIGVAVAATVLSAFFAFDGDWGEAMAETRKKLEAAGIDYAKLVEQLRPLHAQHFQAATDLGAKLADKLGVKPDESRVA